jgi:hypothetical protein
MDLGLDISCCMLTTCPMSSQMINHPQWALTLDMSPNGLREPESLGRHSHVTIVEEVELSET